MNVFVPAWLLHTLIFVVSGFIATIGIFFGSLHIGNRVDKTNGNDTGIIAVIFMLIICVLGLLVGLVVVLLSGSILTALLVTVAISVLSGLLHIKMMGDG